MEDHMNSKIPLKLLLIAAAAFAVNLVVILGIQLLVLYPYSSPADAEALGRMDKAYAGCVIVDLAEETANPERDLTVYLVQTPDGQEHLVTVRRHYLFDRYRIEKNACQILGQDADTVQLRAGSTSFRLEVTRGSTQQPRIQLTSSSGGSPIRMAYGNLMFWIVLLCVLELAAYHLLFEKKQTA